MGQPPGLGHRFFQHLLVEFDADLTDMARLFGPQKVAGAADVEIMAGQRKSGAQGIQGLHDLEALFCRRRKHAARRQGQIGIGPDLGPPDAAAQLIKLRQPKHVGAVDDDGVDRRQVEPGFDDVGRNQHVEGTVVKLGHRRFQVPRPHASVGGGNLDLGHQIPQRRRDTVQVADPGADEKRLPAAVFLAQDRLADDHRVIGQNEGAHRQPVHWRRRDQAHFAKPRQRLLQSPRDRRRRQGQHMDVGLQFLQPLLVGDAEMLLLVDDQEA